MVKLLLKAIDKTTPPLMGGGVTGPFRDEPRSWQSHSLVKPNKTRGLSPRFVRQPREPASARGLVGFPKA